MRMASRALYRSRQFFGSVRPNVDAQLKRRAFALLSPSEQELFSSMTLRDQEHCLAVYAKLAGDGHDDPDLLAAALLHDAGKGRIALWHRVAFVVADATAPDLLDNNIRPGDGPGWREALYRCRHHARLGADLARQAGANDRVAALIAEDPDADQLAALHAADEAV